MVPFYSHYLFMACWLFVCLSLESGVCTCVFEHWYGSACVSVQVCVRVSVCVCTCAGVCEGECGVGVRLYLLNRRKRWPIQNCICIWNAFCKKPFV